jgi:hypothetical protein
VDSGVPSAKPDFVSSVGFVVFGLRLTSAPGNILCSLMPILRRPLLHSLPGNMSSSLVAKGRLIEVCGVQVSWSIRPMFSIHGWKLLQEYICGLRFTSISENPKAHRRPKENTRAVKARGLRLVWPFGWHARLRRVGGDNNLIIEMPIHQGHLCPPTPSP